MDLSFHISFILIDFSWKKERFDSLVRHNFYPLINKSQFLSAKDQFAVLEIHLDFHISFILPHSQKRKPGPRRFCMHFEA